MPRRTASSLKLLSIPLWCDWSSVEVGFINDDFIKGKKAIRADIRAAFVVYRPAAFCTVTGI